MTCLQHAIDYGSHRVVSLLINTLALDPNSPMLGESTVLHLVARSPSLDVLFMLMEHKGVDIAPRDKYGQQVLHYAVLGGHVNNVRYLLAHSGSTRAL
jgi:ankyrin repeat protein